MKIDNVSFNEEVETIGESGKCNNSYNGSTFGYADSMPNISFNDISADGTLIDSSDFFTL